jgi:hypothetical protein
MQVLAGNGICLVCHKSTTPHLPLVCPLLKELNLKLVRGPTPSSKATPAPAPAAAAPAASPTPGGKPAVAQSTLGSATLGSTLAPSGLMALVDVDYDSDNSFRWEGDKDGVDYIVSKSNPSTSSYYYYPLCNRAWLHLSSPSSPSTPSMPSVVLSGASSMHMVDLPKKVHDLISHLPMSTIFGATTRASWRCSAVANTEATDHMFPDKSDFFSYKAVSNL